MPLAVETKRRVPRRALLGAPTRRVTLRPLLRPLAGLPSGAGSRHKEERPCARLSSARLGVSVPLREGLTTKIRRATSRPRLGSPRPTSQTPRIPFETADVKGA